MIKYEILDDIEHVLKRPGMYLGDNNPQNIITWLLDKDGNIKQKEEMLNSALMQIVEEPIQNTADHYFTCKEEEIPFNNIDISCNSEEISCMNSGGITSDYHDTYRDKDGKKVRIIQLIFCNLRSGSNLDDNTEKTVGGQNGFGIKLSNIFSLVFEIESVKNGKKYKQLIENNMTKINKAKITYVKGNKEYTKITFRPDFKRFGVDSFSEEMIEVFRKRLYDIKAYLGNDIKVTFNKEVIKIKNFQEYVNRFTPKSYCFEIDNWKIGIGISSDNKHIRTGLVNGICTTNGKHFDYICNQITKKMVPLLSKKAPNLTQIMIKDNIFLVIICKIPNPRFDSQTKNNMTTPVIKFKGKYGCEIPDSFIKTLCAAKSEIATNIIDWYNSKEDYKNKKEQSKTDGSMKSNVRVPKYDGANDAGTKNSKNCTLILTEGDSAKAFAMAGMSIVGRKNYGVFPLKGKLLNVRQASSQKAAANQEFIYIKKILGLQTGLVYTLDNIDKLLRYGTIMIMTDADVDGSHIKGLLINLIHYFWPSLLKIPNFIVSFITPIVKVTKKKGKIVKAFYTLKDYEKWKKTNNNLLWNIKYYKGLGTSTSKEAKEYFKELDKHTKLHTYNDECDKDIELAFAKEKADDRKKWLMIENEPEACLNNNISSFINIELKEFSLSDNVRSIPNIMDGLKPSQRKVLYGCLKKNSNISIKVANLAGYVSEQTSYHHGEASLHGTIINMAQNFVGSNNINLLTPDGQFGTRMMGGSDSASPRYIFTKLEDISNIIFMKEDNYLLEYLDDDGTKIEPKYYLPIIPMILVNGCEGIGTGFSTKLPQYNPKDIIKNIKNLINDTPLKHMMPWFRGFKGSIEYTDEQKSKKIQNVSMCTIGNYEIKGLNVLITELPIGIWTNKYKDFLDTLIDKKIISKYTSDSTDEKIQFNIKLIKSHKNIEAIFKLRDSNSVKTSNIHLFNNKGVIEKYTIDKIFKEFYEVRLKGYERRHKYIIDKIEYELNIIQARLKFVEGIIDDSIIISKKTDEDIEEILSSFPKISALKFENYNKDIKGDYEYLLSMPMKSMSHKKLEELKKCYESLLEQVKTFKGRTPKELWITDLKELWKKLDKK